MTRVETAIERHDRMVREEKLQADEIAGREPPQDIWRGLAGQFRASERGSEPELIDLLVGLTGANGVAIDVGAGGGRLAIPLARSCRMVVAVEPSASMCEVLGEEVARAGVSNVQVVTKSWEEADVPPAELVFASHVTYGVQVIEPFLRKMDRVATGHAALVTLLDPPQHAVAPLWQAVHGVERLRLPCRYELLAALEELGAKPDILPLPPMPPLSFGPRDAAIDILRRRLFIGPDSPADTRLLDALDSLTELRDGELWPTPWRLRERVLLSWKAGSFS